MPLILIMLLRIVGMAVCSSKAKELNRSKGWWGFWGFVSPIIAMIIIHTLKPITIWNKERNEEESADTDV